MSVLSYFLHMHMKVDALCVCGLLLIAVNNMVKPHAANDPDHHSCHGGSKKMPFTKTTFALGLRNESTNQFGSLGTAWPGDWCQPSKKTAGVSHGK